MEVEACSCDFDGDYVEYYDGKVVNARKEHRCCHCGEPIPKGTKYWCATGKFEGEWETYKSHVECNQIARDYACGLVRGARSYLLGVLGMDYVTGEAP